MTDNIYILSLSDIVQRNGVFSHQPKLKFVLNHHPWDSNHILFYIYTLETYRICEVLRKQIFSL